MEFSYILLWIELSSAAIVTVVALWSFRPTHRRPKVRRGWQWLRSAAGEYDMRRHARRVGTD